jgi:hypothetical protein
MTLRDLKTLLLLHPAKSLSLILPRGEQVPVSFHITEIARIRKDFIDCGGRPHSTEVCQLQAWIGPDADHRLTAGKLAGILRKAGNLFPSDNVPLELEYEDGLLSQFPVTSHHVTPTAILLTLSQKHADCLAPDVCLAPQ